jgi:hypothetical protein
MSDHDSSDFSEDYDNECKSIPGVVYHPICYKIANYIEL